MALTNTTVRLSYTGNGVTDTFAFTPPVLKSADLKVYQNAVLKTITTHYTLTGAPPNTDGPYASGAGVVFVIAPAANDKILLIRTPAITQDLDLIENDPLPVEDLETELDILTMIDQRLSDRIDRCLQISDTDLLTTTLNTAVAANKALIFDASGNLTTSAGDFVDYPGAAATSAAAAAVSAAAALASETSATASATSATSSATSATASATSATASATSATASASSATTSAATATTQASNASTSATNAATSATSASGSATSATSSASSATTSASSATTSASGASTSATAAAASATAAAASAVAAASISQMSKSVDYTTVLTDAGKHIYHPVGDDNPRTFTIDSNANVAYPIGTAITFVNDKNTLTIAITSDVMVLAGGVSTGNRTMATSSVATALKVTSTRWIISGAGIT